MRVLLLFFLLSALTLCGEETGHKKYVSFEQEGKVIDGFLSRTYTLVSYSWEQGEKYLARFRQTVVDDAEKKKQEVRGDIRKKSSLIFRKGSSQVKEAGDAARSRLLP